MAKQSATPLFIEQERISTFRKMASAWWIPSNDPQIYGSMNFDMSKCLKFMEDYSKKHDTKITMTHLVAKAVALILAKHPNLNAKVEKDKIMLRQSVDIFLQVATEGGRDLSGVKLNGVDKMSLADIAARLREEAEKIRAKQDKAFQKSRDKMGGQSIRAVRRTIKLGSWLVNVLGKDMSHRGMPVDPFGAAMITSVGMFGIETAFAPLVPIARCAFIILVTQVKDKPWVDNGELVIRPVLKLCATFDHRVITGAQAGMLANDLKEIIENPEILENPSDFLKKE